MAGRSVNVELKVKAQDEASKALDTVAKSLKDLGSAGTALQGGTDGVGKFVESIGKNLGSLDAVAAKFENNIDKIGKSEAVLGSRLNTLTKSVDAQKAKMEELVAVRDRYQQQLSKGFVGPVESGVNTKSLRGLDKEIGTLSKSVETNLRGIDSTIGKIADGREALRAFRLAQIEVESAAVQTTAELLRQEQALVKLTAAEKQAGAAAEQAAANRRVGAMVNRVTGVDRAPVDNAGIRAQRETDLAKTFAPVFAAEDVAATREAAAAFDVAEKQAKEAASALAQMQQYARDVAEALDPAAKATRLLAAEQERLDAAVSGGFLSKGQADAQIGRFKAQLDGSALAAEKTSREFDSLSTYVQELRREFDRAGYAEQFLTRETAKLDLALKTVDKTTGKSILQQHEYVKALEAVKRKSEQLGEQSNPKLFGLNPYQTQNLLYQFNDIGTQLASGTSLTQTLSQQGGQILQLFPEVGNSMVKAFRGAGAAGGVLVGVLAAVVIGINEALTAADRLRDLEAILRGTADGANYSATELVKTAKSMREIGIATDDAMKIVRIAMKSGFDQSAIAGFGEAAKGLAVVLGTDITSAAQTLADALTGGYDALVDLDKQTNVFTDSELNNLRAMIENGDALGANAEAARILTDRYGTLAKEADGPWDKALNKLTDSWGRLKESLANSGVIQGLVKALTAVADAVSDIVDGVDKLASNPVGASIFGGTFAINPAAAVFAAGVAGRQAPTPPVAAPAANPRGTAPQSELDAILARAGSAIKRTGNTFSGATAGDATFYAAEIKRANELLGILNQQKVTVRDIYRDTLERAKADGKVTTEAEKQQKLADDLKRIRVEVNRDLGAPRNAEERRIAEEVVQERLNKKAEEYTGQLKQIADARKRAADQAERESAALAKEQATMQFQAKQLLRKEEGFRSKAYWDVDAYRVGYGSDTVTAANGSTQRVTANTTTDRAGAERDLARRIEEFANVVKQQIGDKRFNQFSGEQQAALVSVAYNYGELPKRIVAAVKEGSGTEIAAAVKGLRNDNGGANAARRDREAAILGNENLAVEQGAKQVVVDRDKKQTEFNADLEEEIAKRERSVEAQRELVGLQGEALLNAQKEQAVQEAIAAARAKLRDTLNDPAANLTADQEAGIRKSVEGGFDLQRNTVVQTDLQTKVNELLALRDSIQAQIQSELERGNTGTAKNLEAQLGDINGRLRTSAQELLDYQIANAEALGLSAEAIDTLKLKQDALNESTRQWVSILGIGGEQIANTFSNLAVNALDQFAQAVANGENVFKSMWTAFRQFAADFLLQMAKMIQQQIIFNLVKGLLSSIGGGLGGGAGAATNSFGGGFSSLVSTGASSFPSMSQILKGGWSFDPQMYHSGGIVGSGSNYGTRVPSSWFANANRYHSGGIAGLKPGEVPSILMRGEEVLTRDDPRHMLNSGGGGGGNVKIVNTFDAEDFFSKGANTKAGEKAIMNLVRANPRAFKQAMGGA